MAASTTVTATATITAAVAVSTASIPLAASIAPPPLPELDLSSNGRMARGNRLDRDLNNRDDVRRLG